MSALSEIQSTIKGPHATGALYIALLSFIIADALPTPMDAVYLALQKDLRDKWKKGEISAKEYWTRESIYYFGADTIWWIIVFIIAISIKGDIKRKMNWILGIVGVGAVIGTVAYLYKEDVKVTDLPPKE